MAIVQALCVSGIVLAACVLVAAEDLSKYPFIVRPPPKNVSCFVCNNYKIGSNDRNRDAVLNRFCAEDPSRVTFFKQQCKSEKVKGCAMVTSDYTEFSATQGSKKIYRIRRFCTDDLLPYCDRSESSRGVIKLCTCNSDFCNPGNRLLPALGLILPAVLATRWL